jgi:hypothetical protein
MSIIHVNQIKTHVKRIFDGHIDLQDVANAAPEMKEDFFYTRALAAYAIHFLSGAQPSVAAKAVTDGGGDNGIDAIYFDESNRRLYLVQSKWIKSGTGEPEVTLRNLLAESMISSTCSSNGSILKFRQCKRLSKVR